MGIMLKYLFYVFLIIVVYLLGVGFYFGNINKKTTIGEVVSDVSQGTKEVLQDSFDATKNIINDVK